MIHIKHWLIIHVSLYTHSLNEQCSLQESKITFKKKGGTSSMRHEKSSFELLVQETPKAYQLLLFPLIAHQKWKLSFYGWRHQLLQIQGSEVLELVMIWMPSPWGLVFMLPESTMQSSKGVTQPRALPSCDSYEPQQCSEQHDTITSRMQ